jgi:hypothetical protein
MSPNEKISDPNVHFDMLSFKSSGAEKFIDGYITNYGNSLL